MWTVWEIQKREQFGERWHTVQSVLAALEELDIHMIEVSPSNIAFRD
jgi:1,2-phenylacetyl-CoA epoxidase PaaB subunit